MAQAHRSLKLRGARSPLRRCCSAAVRRPHRVPRRCRRPCRVRPSPAQRLPFHRPVRRPRDRRRRRARITSRPRRARSWRRHARFPLTATSTGRPRRSSGRCASSPTIPCCGSSSDGCGSRRTTRTRRSVAGARRSRSRAAIPPRSGRRDGLLADALRAEGRNQEAREIESQAVHEVARRNRAGSTGARRHVAGATICHNPSLARHG